MSLPELADLVAGSRRLLVLTGAGCSTESGIPDYRNPDGSWKHSRPMQYRDFVGSREARRRYWARSMAGWRRVAGAEPNPAHLALARLERAGRVHHLITQNVDGLHGRAGSRRVIDLHGRLDRIECLECRIVFSRAAFQEELERLNPAWVPEPAGSGERARPDGDVELAETDYSSFRVPHCPSCAGDLKPAVVFFGERIPRPRTARALALAEEADALLVVGSSLMVGSGYRFVRRASRRGVPVAVVNLGRTRGDDEAGLKIESRCGRVLPELADRLGA
jgi:NAD-dependent SIR2 family protein deacetylase